jgi:hypothetical protein
MAQGRCRGVFVARTAVRDAAYLPPEDDGTWFDAHPGRRHRLRAPHPDDARNVIVPATACSCKDHVVIVRDLGDYLLAVRLPAHDAWPSADDETHLAAMFDLLVATDPRLAAIQRFAMEEEEEQ